jgi:hypothetical protein
VDFNNIDVSTLILLGIAVVLALPGGLFVAYLMSLPRARLLSMLGGIIGDGVIALGILYFVVATNPSLDGLSFFLGSFFGCSVGVAIGALLANFVVAQGSRGPDVSSLEY